MNNLPSLFSLLCAKCFRKNISKKRLFYLKIEEFTNDYITRKLDILSYLKMNDQFCNLKKIMLNEYQEKALNYFERIDIMNEESIVKEVEKMKIDEQKERDDLVRYFRNINQHKNGENKLDQKILLLLNEELKEMINK